MAAEQVGPDLATKPGRTFHIRFVIERSDKDAAERLWRRLRREIAQVDAIGNYVNEVGRSKLAIEFGFHLAHDGARSKSLRQPAFDFAQAHSFAPVEPRLEPAGGRIVEPFLAIQIDQIDDGRRGAQLGQIHVGNQARGRDQNGLIARFPGPGTKLTG